MINFDKHYESFLGIEKETRKSIISCKRRDETFCFNFKQILIVSSFKDSFYFSIAPQYHSFLKRNFESKTISNKFSNLFYDVDDFFCEILDRYKISRYLRLSNPKKIDTKLPCYEKAETLDESKKDLYFKLIGDRGLKYKEKQWMNRLELISEKRYFVIVENDEIAAYSFLSDIDFGGANIVVVTLPRYRKKGYGKTLVSKAIEWCNRNDLLPIYFVDQQNVASINLAMSLGFETMSNEIIVTV